MKKIIAIYQIVSGVAGLCYSLYFMTKLFKSFNLQLFFFILITAIIGTFIGICGYLLLSKSSRKVFILNFLSQLLQSVSIAVWGFFFKFYFGLSVFLGIEFSDDIGFKAGVAFSEFTISTLIEPGYFYIGINFVALILMFWFWENWKNSPA